MKTTIKIAVIAMMGINLGVKGNVIPKSTCDKASIEIITPSVTYCNTNISNSYVKIYQITTNNQQLASNVRVSATSYADSHVGNFTADILVNHHKDVFVKSISGDYTQGTIKIESDNNGNYFMSYKTTSPNSARYYFRIEALSSEVVITSLPTGQSPTKTVHEHKTNFGTHESGTGRTLSSIYEGKVGVGTLNPSEKLEVKGNVLLKSDSYIHYAIERGNGARSRYGITSGTHDAFLSSSGNLKFLTNNNGVSYNTAMFLNGDGNLGIGTINPDMKLTVKGNIHAEEMIIDLNIPAPDYVFKSDYKLRSLEEVENYIKKHSHLPEIPSAKEFAEKGVKQAEMDMNLLKKIEELTLYTLAQEKKIKSLEKQNSKIEEQQKKIERLEILVEKLLKDKRK